MMLKIGTVTSVLGTDAAVVPDGSTSPIVAVDCCGCQVADRVVMQMHATQALAIAIVGGPHKGAEYAVDAGTANGWYYVKYSTGRVHAWNRYSMSLASYTTTWSAIVGPTVTLPMAMQSGFVLTAEATHWAVCTLYHIAANDTSTTADLGIIMAGTSNETMEAGLVLDGFAQ